MLRLALLGLVMVAALGGTVHAGEKKPPVPPGRDPGGVAVALISTGIDYTRPALAVRLARDGEGELIGWDLVDNDRLPFDISKGDAPPHWGGDGTALAMAIGGPGRRIVPVRVSPTDPASLARAVTFIAHTPARIVVVPMWSGRQSDWEPFRQAATRFKALLFIVAAGDEGRDIDREPIWPAAFGLANVLVVTAPPRPGTASQPNTGPRTISALVSATEQPLGASGEPSRLPENTRVAAATAAGALAECWPQLLGARDGEALKHALLAEAARASPGAAKPVVERCVNGTGSGARP